MNFPKILTFAGGNQNFYTSIGTLKSFFAPTPASAGFESKKTRKAKNYDCVGLTATLVLVNISQMMCDRRERGRACRVFVHKGLENNINNTKKPNNNKNHTNDGSKAKYG